MIDVGTYINEKYQIVELIGEVITGFVYKVVEVDSDWEYAIKILKSKINSNYIEDVLRFKRECKIISQFIYPNIVLIYGTGDLNGVPFILMELIGWNVIFEKLKKEGILSIEETLLTIIQIAKTLQYAHNRGIIHLVLKPANVFINKDSKNHLKEIKLIDFRMAILFEIGELNSSKRFNNIIGETEHSRDEIIELNQLLERKVLERTRELNEKNFELEIMIEKLREHAKVVEELAIEKERNRIIRDIHDTLGYTMTLVITLLEAGRLVCLEEPKKALEKINAANSTAKAGLKELRRTIKGLGLKNLKSNNLINALRKLMIEYSSSGTEIDFNFEVKTKQDLSSYNEVVYRVCQESITNAIRHGKAKYVTVNLDIIDEFIKLFIIDNGKGCKNIKKGMGLNGMEQRINGLSGKLVYGSGGESGFNLYVEIPLKKQVIFND